MRLFPDPAGSGTLFFDNLSSPTGGAVAYDPVAQGFVTGAPFCANRQVIGCNWAAEADGALCPACATTKMSPDASVPNATEHWADAEASKRWVLATLRRWDWFGPVDTGPAPVFHMLAEGAKPVVMGHGDGVVTISVAESNPVIRAERREALDERYRTMTGHIRHEIAHLLWWRLSVLPGFLDAFRALFGDERADYGAALDRHYTGGPPAGWQDRFLTPYASAHPHEDWAETTAHLLHLTDITDSFLAAGLSLPEAPGPDWDAYAESDSETLLRVATAIAIGINHVNRSMGLQDLYPFVLSDTSRQKLGFAHEWLRRGVKA